MKFSWVLCAICLLVPLKMSVAHAGGCSFKKPEKLTENGEWAWLKSVEDIELVELCDNDNLQEQTYIIAYSKTREYASIDYKVVSYVGKSGEAITVGYLFPSDDKKNEVGGGNAAC